MRAVLEGELVCLGDDGRSLFHRLLYRSDWPSFFAFHLLEMDVEDLRDQRLVALSGEAAKADEGVVDFEKRWAPDTMVTEEQAPVIRAAIELDRHSPETALDLLRKTAQFELRDFHAMYVRGLAYLQAKRGVDAAGEFQKILDHEAVEPTSPYMPFARLALARARLRAMSREHEPRTRTSWRH
jgi:hypothetical protein